jgi:restriction endonuclease Mrr
MDAWQKCRQTVLENKKLCPHGIPGGQTLHQCGTCNTERAEEKNRIEKERQEIQRLQKIKQAFDSLRREEIKRLSKARVGKLDFLLTSTPQEFENIVAAMFSKLGYSVKQTPYTNDRGKDAIAKKDGKKNINRVQEIRAKQSNWSSCFTEVLCRNHGRKGGKRLFRYHEWFCTDCFRI